MKKYSNDDSDKKILLTIKKNYRKNQSKPFILSEKQLKEKIYKVYFFSKGDIWTGWYSLKLLFERHSSILLKNGIFGLISGVYIYDTYIKFIKSNDGNGHGDDFQFDLLNLKNDYNSYFRGLYFTEGKNTKQITQEEKDFLLVLFKDCNKILLEEKDKKNEYERIQRENKRIKKENQEKRKEEKRKIEEQKEIIRKEKLEVSKRNHLTSLDKDGNGEIIY